MGGKHFLFVYVPKGTSAADGRRILEVGRVLSPGSHHGLLKQHELDVSRLRPHMRTLAADVTQS